MSRKDVIVSMHQVLIERRDNLRKALDGDLSLLRELASSDVAEPDSSSTDVYTELAEAESRELACIEYALEQMREGNYGECEGCGINIPTARLYALPYAAYCIKCQREAELLAAAPSPTT